VRFTGYTVCLQALSSLGGVTGAQNFLRLVNNEYLVHADALHHGEFTNQAELGAADRADLENLGVPKGAAGLIIKEAAGTGDSFAAWIFRHELLDVHYGLFRNLQCC